MPEMIAAAIISAVGATGTAATLITIGTYVVTTAVTVFAAKSMAESAMAGLGDIEANMGAQIKMSFRTDHPRRLVYGTSKLAGPVAYLATSDAASGDNPDNKYLHVVMLLGEGPFNGINNVFFGDTDLELTSSGTDSAGNTRWVPASNNKYAGLVRVKKHLGATSQNADPDLISATSEWTANHRLRGIAYLYVRLEYDQDTLASIPNISAIVQGKQVYDPRTNSTVFSNNPALCIRDFLLSDNGLGASTSEVDDTRFIEQANVCDQTVTLDSSGNTQTRYTLDGTVALNTSPVAIMDQMLACCVGSIPYVQGKHQLQVGAAIPNSRNHNINTSFLAGNVVIQTDGGKKNRINAVRGTFMDPANNYNVVDFAPYTDSTYETEDGEKLWADVAFNFVKDNKRAQRIAKLLVERNRQSQSLRLNCNLKAFHIAVNDTITFTLDRDGTGGEDAIFTNKKYRVTSWSLQATGGVLLEAVEEANAIYSWNFGDTFGIDIAPNTSLPNPRFTAAPTNVTATEGADLNRDGALLTSLTVSWTKASDAFTGQYEVFLEKHIGGSTYLPISSQRVGSATSKVVFGGLQVGTAYRASVQSISVIDVRSALAYATVITLAGDNTAPAVVTPTVIAGHKRVKISWTNPTDLDFAGVEIFRRTSSGLPANNVAPSISVAGIPGVAQDILDEGLTNNQGYHYWLRTVDYTGNKSAWRPNTAAGATATPSADSLAAFDNSSTGFVDAAGAGAAAPVQTVTVNGGSDITDSNGDADVLAVTEIKVNGTTLTLTDGSADITALTGITFNSTPVTVTSGGVTIDALTGVQLNGTDITATSAGVADIDAVTEVKINGSAVTVTDGSAAVSAVTEVKLNGTVVTPSSGSVDVTAIDEVKLNGTVVTPSSGSVDVAAIDEVKLNGQALTPSSGSVDVEAVNQVKLNGTTVTPTTTTAGVRSISIAAVDEVKINGTAVSGSNGSVDLSVLTGIDFNGTALTASNGTMSLSALTGVTMPTNTVDANGNPGSVTATVASDGSLTLGAMANIDSISTSNASLFLANSIVTNNMLAGSITAGKLQVTSLSAISASAGTITAGLLQNDADDPTFVIDLTNGTITIST